MKCLKSINLLDNMNNQLSHFRTKNWVGVNDDAHVVYNANIKINFKTKMLKISLCDYTNAYLLVKENITITEAEANTAV